MSLFFNDKPFTNFGSGALPGKMWVVWIIENNEIDAYSRSGKVK